MVRYLVLFLFLFCLFGCSRAVKYTASGQPVCPYCYAEVEKLSEFCQNCQQSFRWTEQPGMCWYCEGKGRCPSCHGSGRILSRLEKAQEEGTSFYKGLWDKCQSCRGKGDCPVCFGKGYVIYGKSLARE